MRAATAIAALIIVVGALAPAPVLPIGDKTQHVIAFAGLAALAGRDKTFSPYLVGLLLAALALTIELLQLGFAPGRIASFFDVGASVAGICIGIATRKIRDTATLALCGSACLAGAIAFELAIAAARPLVTHALLERAWRDAVLANSPQFPWRTAPARATLRLAMRGTEVVVVDSIAPSALAISPGVWPGVRPGDAGTTIVLGHRNGPFRILDNLEAGDVVSVETAEGERRLYRVDRHDVVRWDHSGLHPDTPGETLALVTCWPVDGSERSPWRLIVRARAISPVDVEQAA